MTTFLRALRSIGSAAVLLLIGLAGFCAHDAAQAADRWPPWQSYGEAEQSAREKLKRRAKPSQTEIDALNRKIEELRAAGKYAEAVPLAQRAVRLIEQRSGAVAPATAQALTTLADLFVAQNKYAEAEPLLKRALAIREKDKVPNSGDIAVALDNLGGLYEKQGRAADAEPLKQRAIVMRDEQLRSDPSKTVAKVDVPAAPAPPLVAVAPSAPPAASNGAAEPSGGGAPEGEAKSAAAPEKSSEICKVAPQLCGAEEVPGGVEASPPPPPKANAEAERAEAMAEEEAKRAAESEARQKADVEGARAIAAEVKARAEAERARAMAEAEAKSAPAAAAKAGDGEQRDGKPASDAATGAEIRQALEQRPKTRALRRAAPPAAAAPDGVAKDAAEAPAPPDERDEVNRASESVARDSEPMSPGAGPGGFGGGLSGMGPEAMAPPAGGAAPADAPSRPMPTVAVAPPPPAASMAPEAATEEQKDWDVVPVFYGTDREVEPNAKRLAFGSDRGRRLQLGRALVTVPKAHQTPQVERPWAIRIPYFDVTIYEQAEDPKQHFTMQEIKQMTKEDFLRVVRERLQNSARFKDHALVFVHGFNTAFDNAVYRTAQIAYDLKFDGAPFLYSWPSGGGVASYTYDRESAEASKPYMRKFLEMVVKETGAKSVSIIAHSMGNQPLLDVLKDMKSSAPEGVVISQVILAAPDVDADTFGDLAQAMTGLANGVTLYAAGNDRALIVSRRFWGHYRAGDVPAKGPLVLPGVDTIDVTALSTDAFAINHSGYAQNGALLKDIAELIETGLRPPGRRALKPDRMPTDKGDYWRYARHPSSTSSVPSSPPPR